MKQYRCAKCFIELATVHNVNCDKLFCIKCRTQELYELEHTLFKIAYRRFKEERGMSETKRN